MTNRRTRHTVIQDTREELNLTLAEFAKFVDMSIEVAWYVENSKGRIHKRLQLLITEALGGEVSDYFDLFGFPKISRKAGLAHESDEDKDVENPE